MADDEIRLIWRTEGNDTVVKAFDEQAEAAKNLQSAITELQAKLSAVSEERTRLLAEETAAQKQATAAAEEWEAVQRRSEAQGVKRGPGGRFVKQVEPVSPEEGEGSFARSISAQQDLAAVKTKLLVLDAEEASLKQRLTVATNTLSAGQERVAQVTSQVAAATTEAATAEKADATSAEKAVVETERLVAAKKQLAEAQVAWESASRLKGGGNLSEGEVRVAAQEITVARSNEARVTKEVASAESLLASERARVQSQAEKIAAGEKLLAETTKLRIASQQEAWKIEQELYTLSSKVASGKIKGAEAVELQYAIEEKLKTQRASSTELTAKEADLETRISNSRIAQAEDTKQLEEDEARLVRIRQELNEATERRQLREDQWVTTSRKLETPTGLGDAQAKLNAIAAGEREVAAATKEATAAQTVQAELQSKIQSTSSVLAESLQTVYGSTVAVTQSNKESEISYRALSDAIQSVSKYDAERQAAIQRLITAQADLDALETKSAETSSTAANRDKSRVAAITARLEAEYALSASEEKTAKVEQQRIVIEEQLAKVNAASLDIHPRLAAAYSSQFTAGQRLKEVKGALAAAEKAVSSGAIEEGEGLKLVTQLKYQSAQASHVLVAADKEVKEAELAVGIQAEKEMGILAQLRNLKYSMWAIVGPAIYLEMIFRIGEQTYELYKKTRDAADEISRSWMDVNNAIQQANLQLINQIDQLDREIAKLEKKPDDALKRAIDEDTLACNELYKAAKQAADELERLESGKAHIGKIAEIFFNARSTTDLEEALKSQAIQTEKEVGGKQKIAAELDELLHLTDELNSKEAAKLSTQEKQTLEQQKQLLTTSLIAAGALTAAEATNKAALEDKTKAANLSTEVTHYQSLTRELKEVQAQRKKYNDEIDAGVRLVTRQGLTGKEGELVPSIPKIHTELTGHQPDEIRKAYEKDYAGTLRTIDERENNILQEMVQAGLKREAALKKGEVQTAQDRASLGRSAAQDLMRTFEEEHKKEIAETEKTRDWLTKDDIKFWQDRIERAQKYPDVLRKVNENIYTDQARLLKETRKQEEEAHKTSEEAARNHEVALQQQQIQKIRVQHELGKISLEEELEQLKQAEIAEHKANIRSLEDAKRVQEAKLALGDITAISKIATINSAIEAENDRHNAAIISSDADAAKERIRIEKEVARAKQEAATETTNWIEREEKDRNQFLLETHRVSFGSYITTERDILTKWYAEKRRLDEEEVRRTEALRAKDPASYEKALNKELADKHKFMTDSRKLDEQEALYWKRVNDQMANVFSHSILTMLTQERGFQKALQAIWSDLLAQFVNRLVMHMVERWGLGKKAMELEDKLFQVLHIGTTQATTAADVAQQTAVTTARETATQAQKADNEQLVISDAGLTYANTFTWWSAVDPPVAPAMAEIASMQVLMRGATMAAFEEGGIVPFTGIHKLHEKEMVLPQNISQFIMSSVSNQTGGNRGGDTHFHNSFDMRGQPNAASSAAMAEDEFVKMFKKAARKGRLGLPGQ